MADIRARFPQYDDLSDSELANAVHGRFYADMPRDEFMARIGFRAGAEEAVATASRTTAPPIPEPRMAGIPQRSPVEQAARSVAEGATFGFFPEIVGAGQAALGQMGVGQPISREEAIARQEAIQQEIPASTRIPGNIAGGLATGLGAARAIPAAATATVPRAAAVGAAEGAIAGAGFAPPGQRVQGAVTGAAVGAPLGAAAPVIGRGIERLTRGRPTVAPQIAQLRQQAVENYDLADQAGLVVKPESFARSVADLAEKISKKGADPIITPNASQALRRMVQQVETGQPLTLREFQTLREIASAARGAAKAKDATLATDIVDHLDDFLGGVGKESTLAGDPVQADRALRAARNLWSRTRKAEEIERLLERAANKAPSFSQSGMENAIRNEFRSLAQNEKRIRRFTKAEQAAIQRVARGGKITNFLRNVGRFAPKGPVSGGFQVGGGLGAEAMLGLPPGSILAPAMVLTGAAAGGARIGTQRAARQASELIRRGAPVPRVQTSPLAQSLVLGGVPGVAGQFGPR